jgi:hypothetical protein
MACFPSGAALAGSLSSPKLAERIAQRSTAYPIYPTSLIHLKLRKLALKTAVYLLAFVEREPKILEPRACYVANDTCDFPTLWHAISADQFLPDILPQLRRHRTSF